MILYARQWKSLIWESFFPHAKISFHEDNVMLEIHQSKSFWIYFNNSLLQYHLIWSIKISVFETIRKNLCFHRNYALSILCSSTYLILTLWEIFPVLQIIGSWQLCKIIPVYRHASELHLIERPTFLPMGKKKSFIFICKFISILLF